MLLITPWERAALMLLAADSTTADVAHRLRVPEAEIEEHLRRLYARMGAASRTDAITLASRRGLLSIGK